MDKVYQPKLIEKDCYQQWEQRGYFAPHMNVKSKPYCILLPPPNVTGSLHIGHAFQQVIMDFLIRYHRMLGDNTLWQPGTDHAGIATQMVVERQLAAEQLSRNDLGRKSFIKRAWLWKKQSGNNISQQMRRLGVSPDWSREKFTLDPELADVVQKVFIQLHQDGLVYRGKRLVNWDSVLQTAISDLEVVFQEEVGQLWHIRYPLTNGLLAKNGQDYLVIATTRPETLLGDSAVAVHPQDTRYQNLIGKQVLLPLVNRLLPIVADNYVDPQFATGCVKITPAHDFNDYALGQRHQLPLRTILTKKACIVAGSNIPKELHGLDRYKARQKIIKLLTKQGLLDNIQEHKLMVPRGDRSGAVIEPLLTNQWYIKVAKLAKPAIAAVEKGDINFIPEGWSKTYFQWMHNIQDWCISRQLWWGHRIPAWYDEQGQLYVGASEQEVRQSNQLAPTVQLQQDEDVLDTWFSSSLWPFASLGWPKQTTELVNFLPSSVLVTGFDIIFFWVARMIMMTQKFTGKIPFKTIYITGLIRDEHGNKMSKSKGNVIDPIDLIDGINLENLIAKRTKGMMQPQFANKVTQQTCKQFPQGIEGYGTDALRFALVALASTSRDLRFDPSRIAGYRNFCNKLWNASRYVLINCQEYDHKLPIAGIIFSLADRWILAQLQTTIVKIEQHITNYRFDLVAQVGYEFTWNQFCDWYLELTKPILTKGAVPQKQACRYVLLTSLEHLLRLLHPIIPFITESIWQQVAPLIGITGASVMQQSYPKAVSKWHDQQAIIEQEWIKQIIIAIRTIRAEMNISPKRTFSVLFRHATAKDRRLLQENKAVLLALAKLENIIFLSEEQLAPVAASALIGTIEVLIPMAGLIDKESELSRLTKKLNKTINELGIIDKKLTNAKFIANAPDNIVQKTQQQQTELILIKDKLLTYQAIVQRL